MRKCSICITKLLNSQWKCITRANLRRFAKFTVVHTGRLFVHFANQNFGRKTQVDARSRISTWLLTENMLSSQWGKASSVCSTRCPAATSSIFHEASRNNVPRWSQRLSGFTRLQWRLKSSPGQSHFTSCWWKICFFMWTRILFSNTTWRDPGSTASYESVCVAV